MRHLVGRAQYAAFVFMLERVIGLRREEATVGGTRVRYLARRGAVADAPPVVLVHGFGADKESWLAMAAFLRRGRALVIPDLPGFGASDPIPASRACAREQAAALLELLDRANIARAHLVGNSMGGGIAQRAAVDQPARVASIVLIGSIGPVPVQSEVGRAFARGENPLLTASETDLQRLMTLVMERPPFVPPTVLAYLGARRSAQRASHAELFGGWANAPPGQGIPVDLATIRVPTLVLHGERDRVIDVATGRALAAGIPGAELAVLRGIGHAPHVEDARGVARRIDAFIDALTTRPRDRDAQGGLESSSR